MSEVTKIATRVSYGNALVDWQRSMMMYMF